MLSMLKLLTTSLLLSSALLSASSNEKVETFLENSFKQNPNIVTLDIKVIDKIPMPNPKGWDALVISLDAELKGKPKNKKVKQKMIWFTNGQVITKDLTDIDTGTSLIDAISPKFKDSYYKKENLIYGNVDAKHKVAIFSDPLCPFCKDFVPEAIKYMKKSPKKFAIYYYHFPLPAIHPAAVSLSLAAIAAEKQGHKDVVLRMYDIKIDAHETDVNKILKAFNDKLGTKITALDLKSEAVQKHANYDLSVADSVMVKGTPAMFFDGAVDKTRKKYKQVK